MIDLFSDLHFELSLTFFGTERLVFTRRNTEIDPFSRRHSKKLYIFWWVSKIGILAHTEIFNFDRYLTDI